MDTRGFAAGALSYFNYSVSPLPLSPSTLPRPRLLSATQSAHLTSSGGLFSAFFFFFFFF